MIIVNPSLEQVIIVVIGETGCWESVTQGSGSRKEAALVEHTSHQLNTEGMWVVIPRIINDEKILIINYGIINYVL